MVNVVLSGGSGKRLWPLSRLSLPKQFLKLFSGKSLFQMTIERNMPLSEKRVIVLNREQLPLAREHLSELGISEENTTFILEPTGRNTAPAAAFACFSLREDEVVLVTPSDHLIRNTEEYEKVARIAEGVAREGFLVTFGIRPKYPETGYGYIEASNFGEGPVRDVVMFHEKPDHATARKYMDMKNFFWNSGVFCFKAGVYLEELKRFAPEIYERSLSAFEKAKRKGNTISILPDDMLSIPKNSIDYAVMEKSDRVKVIPADLGWNDLGSFDSLYSELPKDGLGNSVIGGPFYGKESHNNLVISKKLVAALGVDGLAIVDEDDALLVMRRGEGQKVRDVVDEMEDMFGDLTSVHTTVYKPWGNYRVLLEGDGYKVKRILVKPGGALSLQVHKKRSENWVVAKGTATVTVGDRVFEAGEGETVFIPKNTPHRLENKTSHPLEVIEVQRGEYLGEDDVVRISDIYGRED